MKCNNCKADGEFMLKEGVLCEECYQRKRMLGELNCDELFFMRSLKGATKQIRREIKIKDCDC